MQTVPKSANAVLTNALITATIAVGVAFRPGISPLSVTYPEFAEIANNEAVKRAGKSGIPANSRKKSRPDTVNGSPSPLPTKPDAVRTLRKGILV